MGDILDSTVNSRNGSSSGTLSFTSYGVIGDAINFSGSESLEISDSMELLQIIPDPLTCGSKQINLLETY